MYTHDDLISLSLSAGAKKAAIIRTEDIVVSSVFRDICASNSCGKYGRCWMCPPDVGEIDPLMTQLKGYSYGLLYQTIYDIEDSFDIEGMGEASRKHAQVSQRVNDVVKPLLPGCLHLSCGGCNLCERCAKLDNQPCRKPDKALPPMEGYGIDVYNTTKSTDLKYINGKNTVTFFGIVLF
ncbi:MAG: DUF2284 domain-containing protein [Aristaeellaceae bacterium]